MIIPGTLYLTDSKELVYQSITNPTNVQRCMVIDLDEQSNELEEAFPRDAVIGTALLPPPSAVFREIDGDHDGFVEEYLLSLRSENVMDYISSVLLMVYSGINTLIYVPCFSEDSVWINILLTFFETDFGFHIGTSATNGFAYDSTKDINVLNTMFLYNCIDVLSYLRDIPPYYNNHPPFLVAKISRELSMYCGDDNPSKAYYEYMNILQKNPRAMPAVIFE